MVTRKPEPVIAPYTRTAKVGVGACHFAPGELGGEDPVDAGTEDGVGGEASAGNGGESVLGEDFLREGHGLRLWIGRGDGGEVGSGLRSGFEGGEVGGDEEEEFSVLD